MFSDKQYFMTLNRRVFLMAATGAGCAAAAGAKWITLFDGKSLHGWHTEGEARWSAENGEIVGRQGEDGGSGDLFTDAQWKDFEMEAEWKMHWPGNSGIWFRYTDPNSAYQADILDQPSHPGVLSGSVYCMGKAFIAENRNAKSVNKDGWNRMRIIVKGDHIVVESNGEKVVDIHDATFPGKGCVGIQAHAGKDFDGMEVRVRNLRLRPL
jgi:hypothetical protein